MTTRPSQGGAPGWRELRAHRIARQARERAERKQERERPRETEEEEEEQAQPRRRGAQRRTVGRHGKASAIVTRDSLKKQRGAIERTSAWVVLLISFVGAIAALHGGFTPLITSLRNGQYNTAALIGGFLLQLLLTFLEWWYFDRPKIAWSARIADALTTAVGYGPLFLAPLALFLYNRGVQEDASIALSWVLIGLISLGIAWFPEDRLVD